MQLNLRVLSCENIPVPEEIIAIDPYIEFKLNSRQKVERTRVIDNSFDPVWKQDFQIAINSDESSFVIDISLRSCDVFKEDFEIGSVTAIVEDLKPYEVRNESFTVNIVDIDKEKNEAKSSSKPISPLHLYTPRFLSNKENPISNQNDATNETQNNSNADSNANANSDNKKGTIVTMMFQIAPIGHPPFEKEGSPQRPAENQMISIANGSYRKGSLISSSPFLPTALGSTYIPRAFNERFQYIRKNEKPPFFPIRVQGAFENGSFNRRQFNPEQLNDQLSHFRNFRRVPRSYYTPDGEKENGLTDETTKNNHSWDLGANNSLSSLDSRPNETSFGQFGNGYSSYPRRSRYNRRATDSPISISTSAATPVNDKPQNNFKFTNDDFPFYSPASSTVSSRKSTSNLNFSDYVSSQSNSSSSFMYNNNSYYSAPKNSYDNYMKNYGSKQGSWATASTNKNEFDFIPRNNKSNNYSDLSLIRKVGDDNTNIFTSQSKRSQSVNNSQNDFKSVFQKLYTDRMSKRADKKTTPMYPNPVGTNSTPITMPNQKGKDGNTAFNFNHATTTTTNAGSNNNDNINNFNMYSVFSNDDNYINDDYQAIGFNNYNSKSTEDDDDDSGSPLMFNYSNKMSDDENSSNDDTITDDDEDDYSEIDTEEEQSSSSQDKQTNRNSNYYRYYGFNRSRNETTKPSSSAKNSDYPLSYQSSVSPNDYNDQSSSDDVVEILSPNFGINKPKTVKSVENKYFTQPTQQKEKTTPLKASSYLIPQSKQKNTNTKYNDDTEKDSNSRRDIRFFFSPSESASPPVGDIKFVYNPNVSKKPVKKDVKKKIEKSEESRNTNENSGPMIYHYSTQKKGNSKKTSKS